MVTARLSCTHVLMQGLAHGTIACEQLLHQTLDLLTQTSFVQVEAEDVLTRVELTETRVVLIGLAYL